MQTTLRVDDRLYREAKAEAARAGVSLTRFIEEGLRLRLEKRMPPVEFGFRTYVPAQADGCTAAEIRRVADEEQEAHDLAKLGLASPTS